MESVAQPMYKADCHFCFVGKLLLALDIRGNVSLYHMIFVHLILYISINKGWMNVKTKTTVRRGYFEADVCNVFSSGGLFILRTFQVIQT